MRLPRSGAAPPRGAPARWRFDGVLADHDDARRLGGDSLEQVDLALGRDGELMAIASPARAGSSSLLSEHAGCRAVALRSLDPPRFERDKKDRPRVLAKVTISDLPSPGPGACGYDAASRTGIVIMRRELGGGRLVGTLVESRLRP